MGLYRRRFTVLRLILPVTVIFLLSGLTLVLHLLTKHIRDEVYEPPEVAIVMKYPPLIDDVMEEYIYNDYVKIEPETDKTTSKHVHYYNPPFWYNISEDHFQNCEYKCRMTTGANSLYKDSDAVLFNSHKMPNLPPKKLLGQLWVFYCLEAPPHHHRPFTDWDRLFNWTLNFRRDADITQTYGSFRKKSTGKRRLDFIKEVNENNFMIEIRDKSRADQQGHGCPDHPYDKRSDIALIVSRCKTPSRRHVFVRDLQKLVNVDVTGKCGDSNTSAPFTRRHTGDCIRPYKFYLGLENNLCMDYVTEKCFRLYQESLWTVPVCRGSVDYSMYLPPHSYIATSDFATIKELAGYLKRVSSDTDLRERYFEWKKHYEMYSLEGCIGYCRLCEHLHTKDLTKSKLYESVHQWLWGHSNRPSCSN